MADINFTIRHIKQWEGGFINDPLDSGGATNMGITYNTFKRFCLDNNRSIPTIDDLKNISKGDWTSIFLQGYWNKWQANLIEDKYIATMLVDWVFNSGKWGIIIPQRLLKVKQDGIVGEITINAVNSHDPDYLFEELKWARIEFVKDIVRNKPTQERFLNGWINRIESIKANSIHSLGKL